MPSDNSHLSHHYFLRKTYPFLRLPEYLGVGVPSSFANVLQVAVEVCLVLLVEGCFELLVELFVLNELFDGVGEIDVQLALMEEVRFLYLLVDDGSEVRPVDLFVLVDDIERNHHQLFKSRFFL
jgi:hypothetical protein